MAAMERHKEKQTNILVICATGYGSDCWKIDWPRVGKSCSHIDGIKPLWVSMMIVQVNILSSLQIGSVQSGLHRSASFTVSIFKPRKLRKSLWRWQNLKFTKDCRMDIKVSEKGQTAAPLTNISPECIVLDQVAKEEVSELLERWRLRILKTFLLRCVAWWSSASAWVPLFSDTIAVPSPD